MYRVDLQTNFIPRKGSYWFCLFSEKPWLDGSGEPELLQETCHEPAGKVVVSLLYSNSGITFIVWWAT